MYLLPSCSAGNTSILARRQRQGQTCVDSGFLVREIPGRSGLVMKGQAHYFSIRGDRDGKRLEKRCAVASLAGRERMKLTMGAVRKMGLSSQATASPLRHVRPKPRGVFEGLLGPLQQRTRYSHAPGTSRQEVRDIKAGCRLDLRQDTGALEHAFYPQRGSFVRSYGYLHPTLYYARVLPWAIHRTAWRFHLTNFACTEF